MSGGTDLKTVKVPFDAFETLRGSSNTAHLETAIERVAARLAALPESGADADAARHTHWALQAALAVLRTEGVVRIVHAGTGETIRLVA